jgi:folate-dependent phosphoribosylglycinamide formyltransferase PurN
MAKKNLVYIGSLRNAAADSSGQYIEYKGESRYMKSPLEYLVESLNQTSLGDVYTLKGIIFDDDKSVPADRKKLSEYGFIRQENKKWFYPDELTLQGQPLEKITYPVPSLYRQLAMDSPDRQAGKSDFETRLLSKLIDLKADVVLLDGLLVILDELIRPGSEFCGKVVNIHPGITKLESPYERRGAYGTLNSLYGARGEEVIDWQTMATKTVETISKTGASFHYVDNGIDSGEVIFDVLKTDIDPTDTILELRWNNFNNSLFPAMHQGLLLLADKMSTENVSEKEQELV